MDVEPLRLMKENANVSSSCCIIKENVLEDIISTGFYKNELNLYFEKHSNNTAKNLNILNRFIDEK